LNPLESRYILDTFPLNIGRYGGSIIYFI